MTEADDDRDLLRPGAPPRAAEGRSLRREGGAGLAARDRALLRDLQAKIKSLSETSSRSEEIAALRGEVARLSGAVERVLGAPGSGDADMTAALGAHRESMTALGERIEAASAALGERSAALERTLYGAGERIGEIRRLAEEADGRVEGLAGKVNELGEAAKGWQGNTTVLLEQLGVAVLKMKHTTESLKRLDEYLSWSGYNEPWRSIRVKYALIGGVIAAVIESQLDVVSDLIRFGERVLGALGG